MRVGIDLGTTNSTVAVFDERDNASRILTDDDGSPFIPSIICFDDDGTVHFGNDAKEMQAYGRGTCVSTFKLGMGDSYSMVRWNNTDYTAEELSRLLIGHLVRNAEERTDGQKITEVVVTVPAYFDEYQRTATIRAAEANGLHVLRIINEPTAAAIHYGNDIDDDSTILVYDLGGGTFDATILKVSGDEFDVISTGGNHNLGGRDWDSVITTRIAEEFSREYGYNILADQHAKDTLALISEQCKMELSDNDVSEVNISYRNNRLKMHIDRSRFEDATRYLLETTVDIINKMMDDSQMSWSKIDRIILVGGSSKMPMVREYLESVSGMKVMMAEDSDLAVSMGASIVAYRHGKDADRMNVLEVTSHSLGALTPSKDNREYLNELMIKRNTRIPATATKQFVIPMNNMTRKVEVYVLQGESYDPLLCKAVSKNTIAGFVNDGNGVILDIKYSYDENGMVSVSAFHDDIELDVVSQPVDEDISWMGRSPAEKDLDKRPSNNIVICIDVSRSMKFHGALDIAKNSIRDFIRNVGSDNYFSIVAFGDKTQVIQGLTNDGHIITEAIEKLKPNMLGRGTYSIPLSTAMELLSDRGGNKVVFILTDGLWERPKKAVEEAIECKNNGIAIASVGLGDADIEFLREISNNDDGAIYTTLDNMNSAFGTIATAIRNGRIGLRMH